MPKAYVYIRMSTDVQRKGDSLRRQRKLSRDYAEKHNLDLQEEAYEDIGVSAFKGNHSKFGALGRFQTDVEDGKIEKGSYLLVESLDRISREDITVALPKFLAFLSAGIVMVTLSDGAKYSQDVLSGPQAIGPLFMSLGIMIRAHEESLEKGKRVAHAWANKRANSDKIKLTKVAPGWLSLSADRTTFIEIPDRVALVRQIYDDTVNGIGTIKIVRRLNQQKVPVWGRSKAWQHSYIKKILCSRTVLGEYQPFEIRSGVKKPLPPKKDYYPAIVTEQVFYAAQAAKASRNRRGGPRGKEFTNLFGGILKCGYCGGSVYFYDKGAPPKGGRYLRCRLAVSGTDCPGTTWAYNEFEKTFLAYVSEVDIGAIVSDEKQRAELARSREDLRVVMQQVGDENASMEKLQAAIEDSDGTEQTRKLLLKRLNAAGERAESLEQDAEKLSREIETIASRIKSAEDRGNSIAKLTHLLNSTSGDERFNIRARLAQLLNDVIKSVSFHPDGFRTTVASRTRIANQMIDTGESEQEAAEIMATVQKLEMENLADIPKRERQFFYVTFHGGHIRYVSNSESASSATAKDKMRFMTLPESEQDRVGWAPPLLVKVRQAIDKRATEESDEDIPF